MDYIKLFETSAEFYNQESQLKKPYVCLTEDDGVLHYARDPRNVIIMDSETNPAVLAICYAQGWCASPDRMTQAEAAAVTNIAQVFRNAQISDFKEFQYFTGVTSIVGDAFQGCTTKSLYMPDSITSLGNFRQLSSLQDLKLSNNLVSLPSYFLIPCALHIPRNLQNMPYGNNQSNFTYVDITIDPDNEHFQLQDGDLYNIDTTPVIKGLIYNSAEVTVKAGTTNLPARFMEDNKVVTKIDLPASLTSINERFGRNTSNLKTVICRATIPPTLDSAYLLQGVTLTSIQVPAASVDTYKATAPWSTYASIIEAIQ